MSPLDISGSDNFGVGKQTDSCMDKSANFDQGRIISCPYALPDMPKKSWNRRHPLLFWGFIILVLFILHGGFEWLQTEGPLASPKIAVINVEGVILDATATVDWIETVRKNPLYKVAVVRINSPGGGVAPSQELYNAVRRLDAEKPVVVSMGAVAASGGYYTALGGREIFANSSTITASIGVKMQLANMEKLMNTLGISEKTLTTGKLKDAGSPMRPMAPYEESYFQALIGAMFDEFVTTIMQERSLTREAVLAVADGRVMTGRQALEAKLIDTLGDYHDAVVRAKELGSFSAEELVDIVEGPEKPTSFLQELIGATVDAYMAKQIELSNPAFMY